MKSIIHKPATSGMNSYINSATQLHSIGSSENISQKGFLSNKPKQKSIYLQH